MKSITIHTKRLIMENGKFVGICKVGEKGQIVIPKDAREMFGINPGDSLVVLCDKEKGMAIVKSDVFNDLSSKVLGK